MEEELSLDNILGTEEIDNLFVEDNTQDTPSSNKEDGENNSEKSSENKEKDETTEVNVDNLFTEPESVGSGKMIKRKGRYHSKRWWYFS